MHPLNSKELTQYVTRPAFINNRLKKICPKNRIDETARAARINLCTQGGNREKGWAAHRNLILISVY